MHMTFSPSPIGTCLSHVNLRYLLVVTVLLINRKLFHIHFSLTAYVTLKAHNHTSLKSHRNRIKDIGIHDLLNDLYDRKICDKEPR